MPTVYIYLLIAVVFETVGTTALNATAQFTRLVPSLIVVASYACAFYFLALTLRSMPVGVVYALWSGIGIVLIAFMGLLIYGQKLDLPAVIGLALIISGIAVIHLWSDTTPH
jgi:small multidrug resistance pump